MLGVNVNSTVQLQVTAAWTEVSTTSPAPR